MRRRARQINPKRVVFASCCTPVRSDRPTARVRRADVAKWVPWCMIRAKMSAKTGTVSVLARFMLPQIARKSAQTVRLLLRGRERIGRRTVISTVRRRQRNSTVAELAEMNMTEGNKNLQGQRKTRQPRYCRPLRPVRFDLNHLIKYGLGFDGESTFVSHIP